jgi:hypothetical protein
LGALCDCDGSFFQAVNRDKLGRVGGGDLLASRLLSRFLPAKIRRAVECGVAAQFLGLAKETGSSAAA